MLDELLLKLGKAGDAYLIAAIFIALSIWLIIKIIRMSDKNTEYLRETSREDARTIEKITLLVEQFTEISKETNKGIQDIKQMLK